MFDDLSGICPSFLSNVVFFVNMLLGRPPRKKVEASEKQEAKQTKKVEDEDNWEVPEVLPY